ncbi:hypothetical protein SAMN05444000_12055 [Shimia gijangensis]|uniref:Uncharacterized protein n=1 Tax=Shimia gijangensis TaxID=1470563 RepID=A0A1M6Q6V0_9RHOB|nr:hypothetical protein [Shimia gijangensis]SHK15921.1 hypothetical protein SAMN05444000_12055 [Shimia gijangensis]
MKTVAITLVLCFVAPMAFAKPTTCRSWQGMEVPYLGDVTLETLGGAQLDRAGRPIILLNPDMLNTFSPLAREFWLAHTCGHHALTPQYNNEEEADCFAMRSLGKKKIRADEKWESLFEELHALPNGSWPEHQPDTARIEALRNCEVPD